MDSITVRFNILKRKKEVDLVIQSFITANELIAVSYTHLRMERQ